MPLASRPRWQRQFLGPSLKLLSDVADPRTSNRGQWFHHRLIPGRHLVAVQPDLNDLEDKLSWAKSTRDSAKQLHTKDSNAIQVLEDLGADVLTAIRSVAR